jgi:Ca2+-binding EF-hand superfamily protein
LAYEGSRYLELRQAFDLFDTDHSGGISVIELKQALGALGVSVSDQEARQMFSAIDIDSKKMTQLVLYVSLFLYRKRCVIQRVMILSFVTYEYFLSARS